MLSGSITNYPTKDDLGILTEGIHIGRDKYFQLMWHAAQIILAYEALGSTWPKIPRNCLVQCAFLLMAHILLKLTN